MRNKVKKKILLFYKFVDFWSFYLSRKLFNQTFFSENVKTIRKKTTLYLVWSL